MTYTKQDWIDQQTVISAARMDHIEGGVEAAHGLAGRGEHPAHLLSGGQKQLLALAAVLVTEPELLVMDEPTTLLDVRNARRVADRVRALPQQVVLVTHHLDLLEDFDRVLVFDESRLVHDSPPADAIAAYLDLMAGTA